MDTEKGAIGMATTTTALETEKGEAEDEITSLQKRTPFNKESDAGSGSSTGFHQPAATPAKYFHSRRIKKGEVERPWLDKKDPREKWVTIIPIIGMVIGLAIAAFLVWDGLRSVVNHTYCPVLIEDFSNGIDPKIWTKEVQVGGFGNGEFEETTGDNENAFIKDGNLWIQPTLQNPSLLNHNHVLNLRKLGTCTGHGWAACVAVTNTTNGTIINPVKSARLTTRHSASIKYGRVEVTARLPAGDWLWPAIWLLPTRSVYGPWPASGEIDIAESRGNNYSYPQGGDNIVSSALHWGPDAEADGWWRTNNKRRALHTTYASGFNTFGLEWSEKYLFTYVNNRLLTVLYHAFDAPLWGQGMFGPANANGTAYVDPWSQTGRDSTPFDQDFFLILDVAVGGTNGWFEDGVAGKPWVDGSLTAMKEFWDARREWYPTWRGGGEMVVKSVKMWQQAGYNGCKEKK